MQWDVEVGPGYRKSKIDAGLEGDDSEELIVRLSSHYSWAVSDNASFSQTVNVESGKDNTITRSVTALSTGVVGAWSLKLSYTVKYTETVPVDTQHADTETAVTLVYSF